MNRLGDIGVNRLGDTSAFVNPTVQLLLTRQGKIRMDNVGTLLLNSLMLNKYLLLPFSVSVFRFVASFRVHLPHFVRPIA